MTVSYFTCTHRLSLTLGVKYHQTVSYSAECMVTRLKESGSISCVMTTASLAGWRNTKRSRPSSTSFFSKSTCVESTSVNIYNVRSKAFGWYIVAAVVSKAIVSSGFAIVSKASESVSMAKLSFAIESTTGGAGFFRHEA